MTARPVQFSPTHPMIGQYHRSLAEIRSQDVEHESALRLAFQDLLRDSACLHGWTFIAELGAKSSGHLIRPDGTVRDHNSLLRGYSEAKDTRDDLEWIVDQYRVTEDPAPASVPTLTAPTTPSTSSAWSAKSSDCGDRQIPSGLNLLIRATTTGVTAPL